MNALTIDQLVNREVNCCLSFLVSTLASGGGAYVPEPKRGAYNLAELCDQAEALAAPIDDWEEAALQAGWCESDAGTIYHPTVEDVYETWADVCAEQDIDPVERESLEFWSVSPWLARKLEAAGEKVDHDFAGLTVWARTTSGQGIAMDSVIVAIYNEMMASVEPRL